MIIKNFKINMNTILKHRPGWIKYHEMENDLKPYKYNRSKRKEWASVKASPEFEAAFGNHARFLDVNKSGEYEMHFLREGDILEFRVEKWKNKDIKLRLSIRALVIKRNKTSLEIRFLKKGERAEKARESLLKELKEDLLKEQEKRKAADLKIAA